MGVHGSGNGTGLLAQARRGGIQRVHHASQLFGGLQHALTPGVFRRLARLLGFRQGGLALFQRLLGLGRLALRRADQITQLLHHAQHVGMQTFQFPAESGIARNRVKIPVGHAPRRRAQLAQRRNDAARDQQSQQGHRRRQPQAGEDHAPDGLHGVAQQFGAVHQGDEMPAAPRHLAHGHVGRAAIAHFAAARALRKGRREAGLVNLPDIFQHAVGPGGIVQNQACILGKQQARGIAQFQGIKKGGQGLEVDVDAHHTQKPAVPAHALGHCGDQVAVVGLVKFGQGHGVGFQGRFVPGTLARIKARPQRIVRRLHKAAVPGAEVDQLKLRVNLDEGAEFVEQRALRAAEFLSKRFDGLRAGRIRGYPPVGRRHGRQLSDDIHNALGIVDHLSQILPGQTQTPAGAGAEIFHRSLPALPEGQQGATDNSHADGKDNGYQNFITNCHISPAIINNSK